MSHVLRRLVYLAMGVLGGLAVWPILELLLVAQSRFPSYLSFSLVSGAAFGLVMGAFFGAIDGIVSAVRRRVLSGALLGAAIGSLGGAFGFVLGQIALLGLADLGRIGVGGARAFGWAILGVAIGTSEGIRRRSVRRLFVGIFGGFLGGLFGGLAIEYAPMVLPVDWARPIGLLLFGALVSAMYGLIERQQIAGVLRLLNGPRKGAEFVLNQRRVSIGAWSGSDVSLAGYRRVADRHAEIRERSGELVLYPTGADAAVKRNDEEVPENGSGFLKYGDVIQCGNAKLLLRPLLLAIAVLIAGLGGKHLEAQSVRPAQVDTTRLVTHQQIDLWAAITDADGAPVAELTADRVRIVETDDRGREVPAEVLAVEERAGAEEGVTFFLLVDNSGSMYDTLDGRPTEDADQTRMAGARAAIRRFLEESDNPRDRFALATFNTSYRLHTEPTDSVRTVGLLLDEIERPDAEEAYTELFRAITLAARDLSETEGRTAIIILSDGENYPYALHSGKPHPQWGTDLIEIDETLASIQRAGIGVFAISFADEGEPLIGEITSAAGGILFRADDERELQSVYGEIRRQILTEYRITYRAGITPSEYRTVRIEVDTSDGPASAERRYFSGTIFGLPREDFGLPFLIPFLAAIALAGLLAMVRARNTREGANLEILPEHGIGTRVLDITGAKTVIGAAADADVTIAGSPEMQDRHATIVRDERSGTYTVVSTVPVTVNNRGYTRRKLEPGDVIELPGATIVFDTPEE